ncbi:MAG: hypothetical protein CMO01_31325 [Thalassobius sp.]|nr:hypothetical protein [Thalassovita sp.]
MYLFKFIINKLSDKIAFFWHKNQMHWHFRVKKPSIEQEYTLTSYFNQLTFKLDYESNFIFYILYFF